MLEMSFVMVFLAFQVTSDLWKGAVSASGGSPLAARRLQDVKQGLDRSGSIAGQQTNQRMSFEIWVY